MALETLLPSVSVVVRTRNDRRFIRDCLDSLVRQDMPIHELIVVDCSSTDGTPQVVSRIPEVNRLVRDIAPDDVLEVSASAAGGDIVCLADARAQYASEAVRECVSQALSGSTDDPGSSSVPLGTTNFGRAVAAMARWLPAAEPPVTSWSSSGTPVRAAVRCWAYVAATPSELAVDSFRSGADQAVGGVRRMSPTAVLPAALVLACGLAAVAGRRRLGVAVLLAHGTLCAAAAGRAGHTPGVAARRAFIALELGHWSAGIGVWRGLSRRGRWARRS